MSLPCYQSYKDSKVVGLGKIPAHWDLKRLGGLCSLIQTGPFGSQLHSEDYIDDATPVVNPSNIKDGKIVADWSCTVSDEIVTKLAHHKLQPRDIVFGRRGEMGRCALVREENADWLCGTGSLSLRLASLREDFAVAYLGTSFIKQWLSLASVGSTMDNLNTSILASVPVPVPPEDEQAAIVAFITEETRKIDALTAEQEKLLTLLAEKRQATISHTVTRGLNQKIPMKDSGVPWLGDVPAHWSIVRLTELFSEVNEPGDESLPILSVSIHNGVSDKELDEDELDRKVSRSDDRSKYKKVAKGDLVYNMMRAWQGGFGAVLTEGMVSPAYVVARPKGGSFLTSFVERILRTSRGAQEVKRYSRGITDFRLRLYWDEFKNIRIALPPLEEQQRIMSRFDDVAGPIDDLVEKATHAIELLWERRSALIAAAVTGKIDVRNAFLRQMAA